MSLIRLDNVSKFYKSGDGVSVGMRKVTTNFNYGEFVAVTGESGSGKSTLLNVISGLDSYEDGEMYIENEETSHFTNKEWEFYRSKYIGFIFQSYNIIDSFTVYQNVLLALEIQNYPKHLRKKRALELIDKVGLSSHIHHKAAKLSGGQKQRTVIARALAKDCPIIVADEPTGNLDSESGKQVIDLLHEISKEKLVVIVTHEFDQVKAYATRRIKMHDGEIVEDKVLKKTEQIENIEKPLQKGMGFVSVLKFALRNIFATPRRTFFILLFQILIMSIFIFGYTLLMTSARNQDQFGSPGFGNDTMFGIHTRFTSDNRFYIMKKDGSDLTQQDYDHLNDLGGGDYYLYKDLTFIDTNNLSVLGVPNGINDEWYNYAISDAKYDSTFSILNIPQFLKSGRLPEADDEIVLSNTYENYITIDTVLELNRPQQMTLEAEYTRNGSTVTATLPDDIYIDYLEYIITFENGESTTFIHWNHIINLSSYTSDVDSVEAIEIFIYYKIQVVDSFKVVGIYNDNYRGTVYMHHDFLVKDTIGDAFMLTAHNKIEVNRIFENIDKTVYRVIYPANNTGASIGILDTLTFIVSLFYFALIFFLALFLYFILYTFIKNIMAARKKDFAIYRSIGANQSRLGWLVIFEQIFIMIMAFIITLIIVFVIRFNDYNVNLIFSQLVFSDYVILFLLFTYLTLWLARRFNKKTFKFSIIENITESKEENL